MREIKYRALSTNNKNWIYGFPLLYGFENWIADRYGIKKNIKPKTVGQYTGLKDKNGKNIYEGDIIHYFITHWINGCPVEREEKRLVSYSDGCFWLTDNKGDDALFFVREEDDEIEVIGNIHENPELLEVTE